MVIKIKELIDGLKKYDEKKKSPNEAAPELNKIKEKLITVGKSAVPHIIKILRDNGRLSPFYAIEVLGRLRDKRAIEPLVDVLEDMELGEAAIDALINYGSEVIPEVIEKVIRKVKYRLAHPIKRKYHNELTSHPLSLICKIKCEESIQFLIELLDDFNVHMKKLEIGPEGFNSSQTDWKYRNLNLFHLIDCMVRQQDKRAIPHIIKMRDTFPSHYVDHILCQKAINRINKGKIKGYLPMEALELAMPSDLVIETLKKIIEDNNDYD